MKRGTTIIVFLNNKLIACDTVVPLLVDIAARRPDLRIHLITFDERTHEAIKRNIVLYDAICLIGSLAFRGRRNDERRGVASSIRHRVKSAAWLMGLAARALLGRLMFVHFKELNEWPLRLLGKLASHRTVYMESTAVGYAPLERKVSALMRPRGKWSQKPVGRYIVGFSDNWPAFSDARLTRRIKMKLPPPFLSGEWHKLLQSWSRKYLGDAATGRAIDLDAGIAVFMLSWMGPNGLLSERDLFPVLFEETLDAYADACPQLPLFLKPHPAMRSAERLEIENRAQHRRGLKIVVSDLHPMMLGQHAHFAMGNCYSTTFSVLRAVDVPTVEYTSYARHILEATGGGSMRPEFVSHFVNRDPLALRKLLFELAATRTARRQAARPGISEPLLALP